MAPLPITPGLTINDDEFVWAFARSGGPGGQHVNTSATKVELRFDVARSPSVSGALTQTQRERLHQRLGGRLTTDGVLVLQASEYRSQARNREAALRRLAALLRDALAPPPPPRRPTRPSAAAQRRSIEAKRRRGTTKALRRRPDA